jgi:hypothetical protein
MRGRIFYQGHHYVLAQDPPADASEAEPKADDEQAPKADDTVDTPAEAPADPDASVDDELAGEAAPEDQDRDKNLTDLGLGGGDTGDDTADADAGPEVEDPDKTSKEIEKSPANNWREYLQPILKDIKQQFGGVPISLLGTDIDADVDVDLGFHITGYVRFLGKVPTNIQEQYGDAPLHFKAFIDPEGKFQRSSIQFYTEA